jgi:hypothetical protein
MNVSSGLSARGTSMVDAARLLLLTHETRLATRQKSNYGTNAPYLAVAALHNAT